MLLTDQPDLHRAEPKTLRYRLLHTVARITRGQGRLFLRLAQHWPFGSSRSRPDAQHHPGPRQPLEDHGDTGHRAGAQSRPRTGQDHHVVLILFSEAW